MCKSSPLIYSNGLNRTIRLDLNQVRRLEVMLQSADMESDESRRIQLDIRQVVAHLLLEYPNWDHRYVDLRLPWLRLYIKRQMSANLLCDKDGYSLEFDQTQDLLNWLELDTVQELLEWRLRHG